MFEVDLVEDLGVEGSFEPGLDIEFDRVVEWMFELEYELAPPLKYVDEKNPCLAYDSNPDEATKPPVGKLESSRM
jgi:hypothetical protein